MNLGKRSFSSSSSLASNEEENNLAAFSQLPFSLEEENNNSSNEEENNSNEENFFSFGRDLHKNKPKADGGKGNYILTADGRKVFDAAAGAAVVCIGYRNPRVNRAIFKQYKTGLSYLASSF